MKPVDRLCAAFECRSLLDRAPLWELHFHCWEQACGRHLVIGREFEALSRQEQERALDEDASIIVDVAEKYHYGGVTIPDGYWETAPGVPSYYWLPDWARLALAGRLSRSPDFMVIAACGGVLAMPGPENYVEFSYLLHDAPEQIDETARQKFRRGLENARKMRDSGIRAVYAAADLADNHGPYYSPRQMDRYILPYLRRWAEAVRAMGMVAILHTDGNINPILTDLIESGIQALQAIDPIAGMDIRQVKVQAAGKVCICGNIDCGLIFTGPPEKVYAVTHQLLVDCTPGGGFVLGASNAIQRETPIEHYEALIHAWEDFGAV